MSDMTKTYKLFKIHKNQSTLNITFMKKIFTLLSIAALASAGASAADFLTIKVDGTEVKNGDVVISNKLEVVEFEGIVLNWELKPDFTIESKEGASYWLTITNAGETPFSYCGVSGASTNTMMCQTLSAGQSWTDEGDLDASKAYKITYDYQHLDLTNIPESLECKGHFKVEAEADSGEQALEFDVNLVYPAEGGSVDGIADEGITLIVGNGRVAASNGTPVEVWTLDGARVANEGLNGVYVVRAGGKVVKIAVK